MVWAVGPPGYDIWQANGRDGLEPYTYSWSTGSHDRVITIDTSVHDFSVIVTDEAGCTASSVPEEIPACSDDTTVTDADGNVYDIVSIGGQCWMASNLRVENGIAEVADSAAWASIYITGSQTPAWCYFMNNPGNNLIHGKLYNWYAIKNGNLCPSGWHVATDLDWQQLINFVGGYAVAGPPLKSTTGWAGLNIGATNSSGFSATGASFRTHQGSWDDVPNQVTAFWTSTEKDPNSAYGWFIHSNIKPVSQLTPNKNDGYSCRCVHD